MPIIFLLLAIIAFSGCSLTSSQMHEGQQSVYDRVLRAGKIRCAYNVYPPYCMKDPNSGKLTGAFVEAMEIIGKNLGLEVTWTDEVGYESLFEGLNSNRYDVFAGGLWPNSARGKAGEFSNPLFYSPVRAYGRATDKRFVNNLAALNSTKVKIAVIDGAMEDFIAREDCPKASRLALPQLSHFSQVLLNVASGKADATFAEPAFVSLFLKSNPGTLIELAPNHPVRVFGNVYVFKLGEVKFKSMFNTAVEEIINNGTVERLLKKYEPAPNVFLRLASPYQTKAPN